MVDATEKTLRFTVANVRRQPSMIGLVWDTAVGAQRALWRFKSFHSQHLQQPKGGQTHDKEHPI